MSSLSHDALTSHTQRYARQKGDNDFTVSVEDLRAFFGINYFMGISKLPTIHDYWSSTHYVGSEFVQSAMGRNR